MTEVDKPTILVDRVVVVADGCEGIPEIPAWRHQGAWIWTAKPNPSAHGCRPISKSFFLRGFVLAVAIHIFADQRRFVARPLEPTRQVICFIAPECRPATALAAWFDLIPSLCAVSPVKKDDRLGAHSEKFTKLFLEGDALLGKRQHPRHVGHGAGVVLIVSENDDDVGSGRGARGKADK